MSEHEPGSWADRHPESSISRALASIPARLRFTVAPQRPRPSAAPEQLALPSARPNR